MNLLRSLRLVSPVYCFLQFLHSIIYVKFVELQVMCCFTVNYKLCVVLQFINYYVCIIIIQIFRAVVILPHSSFGLIKSSTATRNIAIKPAQK